MKGDGLVFLRDGLVYGKDIIAMKAACLYRGLEIFYKLGRLSNL